MKTITPDKLAALESAVDYHAPSPANPMLKTDSRYILWEAARERLSQLRVTDADRAEALAALDELYIFALGEGTIEQSVYTRSLKDTIRAALSSPAGSSETAQSSAPVAVPEGVDLHPSTADLVQRFSLALAEKLAAAEKKYGYTNNWQNPYWMDECRQHLLAHVAKGDPRDVAAYCAFLWHHGEPTAAPQPDAQDSINEQRMTKKETNMQNFTDEQIKHMVNQFLGWKLPEHFKPDGGISFEPVGNKGTPHEFVRTPQGTNLMGYDQAREMVLHMLAGLPDAQKVGE